MKGFVYRKKTLENVIVLNSFYGFNQYTEQIFNSTAYKKIIIEPQQLKRTLTDPADL